MELQVEAVPLRRLSALARRGGVLLLDLLLPPTCLTCSTEVSEQGGLCPECFGRLTFITAPYCGRCGVPFPHAAAHADGLCPACTARPPVFGTARAALRYDDGAKRLILPFKHSDRTELAAPLARHMARAGAELLARAELIVPVPLHWRRFVGRRYNQAALLAQRLARHSRKPCIPDALLRRRATTPLGRLGAAERAAALDGVFAVRRGAAGQVAGRRVLLVDDVLTSGATAGQCARALLEAGAADVDVLAAARVPDPRAEEGRAVPLA